MSLPTLPADKANHYVYGTAAALGGAALGLWIAMALARSRVLPPWPWLVLVLAAACAVLVAWLAGRAKEKADAHANACAYEIYLSAVDAAIGIGAMPPPPYTAPHEVSAEDVHYTAAGALPVSGALLLVALATLWR